MTRAVRAARRLVEGPVIAAGVLSTYDPQLIAGVAAAGMGAAAGLGGGGGAASRIIASTASWGDREKARYVPLPHRVLAVVTDNTVQLFEWSALGAGKQVHRWRAGDYRAQLKHSWTDTSVRIVDNSGKIALLSTPSRLLRHRGIRTVQAITQLAKTQSRSTSQT